MHSLCSTDKANKWCPSVNAKWLKNLLLKQRSECIVFVLQIEPINKRGSPFLFQMMESPSLETKTVDYNQSLAAWLRWWQALVCILRKVARPESRSEPQRICWMLAEYRRPFAITGLFLEIQTVQIQDPLRKDQINWFRQFSWHLLGSFEPKIQCWVFNLRWGLTIGEAPMMWWRIVWA